MATTNKGIYYPTDYTKVADVPADMKALAESVDTAIENSEYDDSAIKQDISNIKSEQTTQNTNISANTTKNAEQDSLIQKLKDNMINISTEEDTSLYVDDASVVPAKLTIRGNHRQEVQEGTDNLAVLNEGTITKNGVTVNIQNGQATVSGTNTSTTDNFINVGTAYLYANQTYYLRRETGSMNGGYSLYKDGTTIWFNNNSQDKSQSIPKTGEWKIRYSMSGGSTVQGTFKVGIYKTAGTEWVQGKKTIPSLEYPSEIETVKDEVNVIVSNKNLYKITASNKTDAGVTFTVNEDGTVVANGTSTGTYLNLGEIYLDAGTYTVSGGPANGDWNKQRLTLYLYKGPTENYSIYRNMTYTFTLTERTRVSLAYVAQSGSVLNNEVIKPMIEYGTVATDFIKHEEIKKTLDIQQEMLKGDDFDLENSKEVHNWKKKIFDGTESWTQSSVASSVFYVDLDITKVSSKLDLVSDQYIFGGLITSTTQCENNKSYAYKTSETSNSARIYVTNNNFTTLESFKNALSEKNMTLYYIAATQTQLDLTETQKQQLAQLNNLDLFKGINNIYTEEGIALMQLDYVADTKMYIDKLVGSEG